MLSSKCSWAYLLAVAVLAIAILPLDWSPYYHFMRLAVTIISIFAAYNLLKGSNWTGLAFIVIAIVFNPLYPLPLGRTIWIAVDVVVICAFLGMVWREKKLASG